MIQGHVLPAFMLLSGLPKDIHGSYSLSLDTSATAWCLPPMPGKWHTEKRRSDKKVAKSG
jgi:hypothetical protein